MIERMTKYSWIVPSIDKENFLSVLRTLGVVDIRRSSKPVDSRSEEMLCGIEDVRDRMTCIRKGSDKHLEDLLAERKDLASAVSRLEPWGEFDCGALRSLGVDVRFCRVDRKRFDDSWKEDFAICEISADKEYVYFVALDAPGFAKYELTLPEMTLSGAVKALAEKDGEIEAYRHELEGGRADLPELERLLAARQSELSLYLAGVTGKAAADDYLQIFEGFAPVAERERLEAEFNGLPALWFAEDATVDDNPPVKLRNNRFVSQFEVLTSMYGLPSYNEFDPTVFLSIFFLLFFAMCMGDAGYGLVLMAVGYFLRGKDSGLGRIWRLIVILGAGTTAVGFVMGGFFGVNLAEQAWMPECLKKCMITGNITIGGSSYAKQMVLSLLIGVLHICLALIMKAVWTVRKDGFRNSLSALGWTLLIVGAVVSLSVWLPGLISETALKWTLIGIGGISALGILLFNQWGRNPLKNIGSGLWDTYSMASGLMGDVLSYIRLYALGLSGGLLGATFNKMAGMVLGDNPVWQWIPFVLIVVFGHVLNIAMSCLGAFVHPLRLNFVEFFKNSSYEGKGREYNPVK